MTVFDPWLWLSSLDPSRHTIRPDVLIAFTVLLDVEVGKVIASFELTQTTKLPYLISVLIQLGVHKRTDLSFGRMAFRKGRNETIQFLERSSLSKLGAFKQQTFSMLLIWL